MKLGSLKAGSRDGQLVVLSDRLDRAAPVPNMAPTLQAAIDEWESTAPQLNSIAADLAAGAAQNTIDVTPSDLAAPLPRAYQWLDGSAYLNHVELVRRARGADMPPQLYTDPLMYQGVSDRFLPPTAPIPCGDVEWGVDFEAEIIVITNDVPIGTTAAHAGRHIKLIGLINDISLRGLIPDEISKGFGFVHGKPPCAMAPALVTPDQLGDAWRDHKLHLPVTCTVNGQIVGTPDAGADMAFDYAQLIAHAAKTRPLGAGTIIGAGTVSNRDRTKGVACLAEQRTLETLNHGAPVTPFLKPGDRVHIEVTDPAGHSLFGAIDQVVALASG